MNTPEGAIHSTAELAMSLVMAMARNVVPADVSMKAGRWDRKLYEGTELEGKTIGLIGLGAVSRCIAKTADSFKMTILGNDVGGDGAGDVGRLQVVDREALLAASDFVVVLPDASGAGDAARLDAAALAALRPTARVVNLAGPGLVDEGALADALEAGNLAGAALDSPAPLGGGGDERLRALPTALLTPRLADQTDEARTSSAAAIASQFVDALAGKEAGGVVNVPFLALAGKPGMKPVVALGEALGSLHAQILGGAPKRVTVHSAGGAKEKELVCAAVLKGMLAQFVLGPNAAASLVNATVLARDRGIDIEAAETYTPPPQLSNYKNVMTVEVESEFGDVRSLSGTLVSGEPRVVQMDDWAAFPVVKPEGTLLLFDNQDQPGTIAKVTALLADAGINISSFQVARQADRDRALCIAGVDEPVPSYVLAALRRNEALNDVSTAHFA